MEARKLPTEFMVDERVELLMVLAGLGGAGLVQPAGMDGICRIADLLPDQVPDGRGGGRGQELPTQEVTVLADPGAGHPAVALVAGLIKAPQGLERCLDLFLALTKPPTICVEIAVARKLWPDLGAGWWFEFGEAVQDFCRQQGFSGWFEARAGMHRTWLDEARAGGTEGECGLRTGQRRHVPRPPDQPESGLGGRDSDPPDLWLLSAWDLVVPDRIVNRRGRRIRVRISGFFRPVGIAAGQGNVEEELSASGREGVGNDKESA